ncbi:alpha/beta-hydrolase [Peniophora sp. CONT]|nr:alpha/beta-hydrolase [Peniophora sp. CONT]
MSPDYYYPLKKAGMSSVRVLVPVILKVMGPPSSAPPPSPSISLTYTPTTGKRRKPIRMNVYLPSGHGSQTNSKTARLPVHVNIHGSGFCIKSFGQDAAFCAWLADSVPCVVVDIDHRKAPEHPWPSGPNDVRDAVATVRGYAETYGWDKDRISLGGFSSGGCLALVEASRPRSEGEPPLCAVVSFYPSTNLAEPAHLKPQLKPDEGAAGGTMPPWFRRFLYACYLPDSVVHDSAKSKKPPKDGKPTRSDPGISPFEAQPANFPPTTIITCSKDSLAREASALAVKLIGAERDVVHWEAAGQGHDWDHMSKEGTHPAALKWQAYELAANRLRRAYGFYKEPHR